MTSANVPGHVCKEARPPKALFDRSFGCVDSSVARLVVACAKYLQTIRRKYDTLVRTLGILAPEAIAIEEEVSREPHECLVLLVAHTIRSHKVGEPLLDEGKLAIGIQVSRSPRDVAVRELALEIASGLADSYARTETMGAVRGVRGTGRLIM